MEAAWYLQQQTDRQRLVERVAALQLRAERIADAFRERVENLKEAIACIDRNCALERSGGLDSQAIALGMATIRVTGRLMRIGNRFEAWSDAIADLSSRRDRLRENWFGCKDCGSFVSQRADCPNGYGPRHGYVVFRIEQVQRGAELTDEERAASIYYLNHLELIQTILAKCDQ
jgi:hypothetical protein